MCGTEQWILIWLWSEVVQVCIPRTTSRFIQRTHPHMGKTIGTRAWEGYLPQQKLRCSVQLLATPTFQQGTFKKKREWCPRGLVSQRVEGGISKVLKGSFQQDLKSQVKRPSKSMDKSKKRTEKKKKKNICDSSTQVGQRNTPIVPESDHLPPPSQKSEAFLNYTHP